MTRQVANWRVSPALIGWLVVLGLLYLIGASFWDSKQLQLAVSVLGLAHSVVGFWSDGGRRISAPGVSFFASGLFVYFPGANLALNEGSMFSNLDLTPAIIGILVMQILTYHLFWQYRKISRVPMVEASSSETGRRPAMAIGIICILIGLGGSFTSMAENPMVGAFAYSGLALFAVAALGGRRNALFSYVIIAAGFVIYIEVIFTGFGRLTLGSLGLALAMAATHRWPGRSVKVALIAAAAPVVMYMAMERVEFTSSMNPAAEGSVSGLESVLSPLARFSQLLDMSVSGILEHSWGRSVVASAVVLVPRELWPEKPEGLGAELGALFRPELSETYTALALIHGEAVYGFGVLGLLLLFPLFAWIVTLIDRLIVSSSTRQTTGLPGVILTTGGVILAASIADLTWGGTFTFASGVAPRLVIVLGLYFAARPFLAIRHAPRRRNVNRCSSRSKGADVRSRRL